MLLSVKMLRDRFAGRWSRLASPLAAVACAAILVAADDPRSDAADDDPPPALPDGLESSKSLIPPRPLLVLRTGGVIQGEISRRDDFYFVGTPNSQIRCRAREVEMICRDWADAYSKKRQAMLWGSADEHLALAEWCLRHQLHGFAARELLDARRISPQHPRTEAVARRLAWATRPSPPPNRHRAADPSVVTASHQEPVVREMAVEAVEPIPAEVVASFTTSVQPLLLNSCTTSGCHRLDGGAAYGLDRLPLHRAGSRRATLRNLDATLRWIDFEFPAASRLLVEAGRAHGSMSKPAFSGHRADLYQKIATWVGQVTAKDEPLRPSNFESSAPQMETPSEPYSRR